MAIQPFHEAVLPHNWAWSGSITPSSWWDRVAFRHRQLDSKTPLPDWIMFDREGYWVQPRATLGRTEDRASGSPVGPFSTFNEAYATFVLLELEG